MASADFMAGIILIASLIIRLNRRITVTPFECMIFWCSTVFVCCLSCSTLLCVSVDRYLKVLMPLRYEIYMSNNKAISIIIGIYIYLLFITFGLLFAGLNQTDKGFDTNCFFHPTLENIYTRPCTVFNLFQCTPTIACFWSFWCTVTCFEWLWSNYARKNRNITQQQWALCPPPFVFPCWKEKSKLSRSWLCCVHLRLDSSNKRYAYWDP